MGHSVVNTLLFQFLIGTIETCLHSSERYSDVAVSIPHRYDRNVAIQCKRQVKDVGFQFLIGTIETRLFF